MKYLVEAIDALRDDPRFGGLISKERPFNLFRVLGIERSELVHSDLLAALLQQGSRNRFAPRFLRALLETVAATAAAHEQEDRLREIAAGPISTVEVHREWWCVDLVIDLREQSVAIGIENKIGAGEQYLQIARYQKSLATHRQKAFILFLTPDGRDPDTADEHSPVPCIPVSWRVVVEALRKTMASLEERRDQATLEQIADHLEEDVIDDAKTREAAREIWKNHREALNILLRYRPRLEDVEDDFMDAIRKEVPDVKFDFYPPQKGNHGEVKFKIPEWVQRGIEFIFMLKLTADGLLDVRLVLWSDDYLKAQKTYQDFGREVAPECPVPIDPDFPTIRGWGVWRSVLAGLPDSGATLDEQGFDGESVREAVTRLMKWRAALEPFVMQRPVAKD